MVAKVRAVRQMLNAAGSAALLSVDGGITPLTAPLLITEGADTLVAGSAIFGAPEGIPLAMAALRSAAVSGL